jgi:hypothetical protein
MSETTPILALPLILPSQADKHVTHNEALLHLEAITQLAVLTAHLTAPPANPAQADRHLIAAGATGAWAGKAGQIALWRDETWQCFAPRPGWRVHVLSDGRALVHDGAQWVDQKVRAADWLGIATTADATNRLAVAGAASLFTHAGAGHQIKLDKAAAGDVASLLFQTGFSGRAEIGTTGDDKLHVKVSGDGAAWVEALVVDPAGGGAVGVGVAGPTTRLHVAGPVRIGQYAKAALPGASACGAGAMVFVTDEAGGPVPAFSDGTAWRRVTDRAVVS